MPFPGSQHSSNVQFAFFLHNNIWWIRIIGILMIMPKVLAIFNQAKTYKKALIILPLALFSVVFYMGNFKFLADVIFKKIDNKSTVVNSKNKVPESNLIIGVSINNEFKAYPIQIIGYHHQIMDTIGNEPVMITYCTVCRTGRVYSPVIDGKVESFRLVGMDQFNAMFEDNSTKSWWQQSTGECVAGKLKGRKLKELQSFQMTLKGWLTLYPESKILQFDPKFKKQYSFLKDYDKGTIDSDLEKSELVKSSENKSWVVTATYNNQDWAFDWIELKRKKILQCNSILAILGNDNTKFAVFDTKVKSTNLTFELKRTKGGDEIIDTQTKSVWDFNGNCVSGFYLNQSLVKVQSYQEFFHSWKTFHPKTNYCPSK